LVGEGGFAEAKGDSDGPRRHIVRKEDTMNKRPIIAAVAGLAFAVMPTSTAFAASPGYSPPPAVGDNCQAGHGTFGAIGGHDSNLGINDPGANGAPGASNPHAPAEGGGTVGELNSDYSASCRTGG
jgi:hypothetical protein